MYHGQCTLQHSFKEQKNTVSGTRCPQGVVCPEDTGHWYFLMRVLYCCSVLHGNGFEGETKLFKEKYGNGCGFTLWENAALGRTSGSIVVYKLLSNRRTFSSIVVYKPLFQNQLQCSKGFSLWKIRYCIAWWSSTFLCFCSFLKETAALKSRCHPFRSSTVPLQGLCIFAGVEHQSYFILYIYIYVFMLKMLRWFTRVAQKDALRKECCILREECKGALWQRKLIQKDLAEIGFLLLFSNLGSVILVWFQQFFVGAVNPSNTKLQRVLVHSGIFCPFWADICEPGNENQENQKNTRNVGPYGSRIAAVMGLAILFFVLLFFVSWFHGSCSLGFLVFWCFLISWVLLSWFVGFIARFPCDRHAGRCRFINVVNLG